MKNIFLTFDYELFFGEDSGSLENSILKPTNLLLNTLKECNVPATFYIDTIYVEKLLECNLLNEYDLVKFQIQRMIKEGHRVELHLHPHWYDAIYIPETKRWKFPTYEHYRLHSYNEKEIEHIFDKSVDILYKIVHKIDQNYKLHSYRAGGWCIQPFDKLKSSFLKHNIYIDSSVVPYFKSKSIAHNFDFSKPQELEYYNFEDDPLVVSTNNGVLEVPITMIQKTLYTKLFNKINLKFINKKIYGDGKGIDIGVNNNFFNKFKKNLSVLTIEDTSRFIFKYYIKQVKNKNIVLVSHPKFLSQESFKCIKIISKLDYIFLTLKKEKIT